MPLELKLANSVWIQAVHMVTSQDKERSHGALLHRALTVFIGMQVVNETLPALVKLREQGLVRFIGITGLPLKIFPYILDRSNTHTRNSLTHLPTHPRTYSLIHSS